MSDSRINLKVLAIFSIFVNPIVIGGHESLCYILIYGIPCLYILINIRILEKVYSQIPTTPFLILLWLAVSLVLSILVPTWHNTNDFSYLNTVLAVFRKTVLYTFLFLIVENNLHQNPVENYMRYFIYANVMYVLGSVSFAICQPLRSFWSSILHLSTATNSLLASYGYTVRFGWSGFSGFRNTIDCSLCIVFLTYLFASKDNEQCLGNVEYIVLTFICFLGNMFYGRLGVVVSLVCVLVGLIGYRKIGFRIIAGTLGGIGVLVGILSFLRNRVTALNEWYIWLSTPFKNLLSTGSFNNYSVNHLLNDMIFLPKPKTFLFGDGRYVNTNGIGYYMNTDSGFMRQILFWGIFITCTMYLVWFISLAALQRSLVLKTMLLVVCILFEIKGEVYYELLPLFTIIMLIDCVSTKRVQTTSCQY